MRFRRIEKDMGGMANVGLNNQHMQGKEDDVTTSDSKTYIGSNGKKKVAMNKIKNTKVGDDIHYYINGTEGRGIVVKMANEYLEIFKEDGQLGTIHINDTFFVKDILINKQWDDMDDTERYEALVKIHAPSPRFITKKWFDIPEEIKELLRKEGGNMAGGTGSTMEEGESKESETKDHARTGFAQNTQYAKKALEWRCKLADCPHCGKDIPGYKGPSKTDRKARWKKQDGTEDWSENSFRYDREQKEAASGKMELGHPDWFDKKKNPHWGKADKKGKLPAHPEDEGVGYVHAGHEAKLRARRHNQYNIHEKEDKMKQDEDKYQKYKIMRGEDKIKNPLGRPGTATNQEAEYQKQLKEAWAQSHPEKKEEYKYPSGDTKREPEKDPSKPTGGFVTEEDYDNDTKKATVYVNKARPNPRRVEGERGASFGTTQQPAGQKAQQKFRDQSTAAAGAISGLVTGGGSDTTPSSTAGSTGGVSGTTVGGHTMSLPGGRGASKAYEVWLERRQEWIAKNKPESYQDAKKKPGGMARSRSAEPQSRTGQATGEVDRDKPNKHATEVFQARSPQLPESYGQARLREGGMARSRSAEPQSRTGQATGEIDKSRAFRKLKPVYEGDTKEAEKSDVEHGHYGNVGREPNVAVSTDTNVDVTEGTGYEERPHISVEEAGKLPRATFNPHGKDELHVSGSQDSKDDPKFSQPHSQEQPVRKAGLPQQHPNTYGMRYGMKGGVKKVWCPEHQMWEETRKDWHEDK